MCGIHKWNTPSHHRKTAPPPLYWPRHLIAESRSKVVMIALHLGWKEGGGEGEFSLQNFRQTRDAPSASFLGGGSMKQGAR